MTAETDSDGIYAFTGLEEGQKYIVEAVNVAGSYMAVRNRGSLAVSGGDFDMVSQAYVAKAADFDEEFDGGTAPRWNHSTNEIENGGTMNFALLWADGTAVGIVNDPSVRMAHEGATVELHRCLVDGDVEDTDPYECRDLGSLDASATASVNAKGEWEAENLVEGMYEVTVDLPARYTHSDMDGEFATPANGTNGYYDSQVAELDDGRGSDYDLETFHIVRTGASTGTTEPTREIKDGTRVLPDTDPYVTYDKSSVSLELTNADDSEDAVLEVAIAGGKFQTFESGEAGTWRLAEGDNTLSVKVTADNGYETATTDVGEAVHRDADTRLKGLEINVGINNDVSRNRAQLEATTNFERDEERRSRELTPGDLGGGNTRVSLGTFTVAAGTGSVVIDAAAMSSNATVVINTGGAEAEGGVVTLGGTTAVDVQIVISDADVGSPVTYNGRTDHDRTYTLSIKTAS